jgi:gamma-glutamyltranspeptidase
MAINGMVVSSAPMATEAGLRILQQGGNAFDAAVAVAAALAVVEPLMSGLGGVGGYALVYESKKHQIRSLDFIGAAPADTKPELFTAGARLWDRAHPARDSFVAPVVPGNLAGWAALHDQYGTMSWPTLLAPAIEYAEKGFVVTPAVAEGFADPDFGGAVGRYPYGAGIFFKDGKPWPVADLLKQPNLAATLRSIGAGGPAVFYGGSLAKRFAEFFHANGGLLTVKDFGDYRARWQDPLHITYRDYDVYSQPPGGSGMTVLQTLNILENFDLRARRIRPPRRRSHEARVCRRGRIQHGQELWQGAARSSPVKGVRKRASGADRSEPSAVLPAAEADGTHKSCIPAHDEPHSRRSRSQRGRDHTDPHAAGWGRRSGHRRDFQQRHVVFQRRSARRQPYRGWATAAVRHEPDHRDQSW